MVKKTVILKESELAELITVTATNIIREQDIEWPDTTSKVPIKTQIKQKGPKSCNTRHLGVFKVLVRGMCTYTSNNSEL